MVIDPIRTSSGELIGYAKITRDLTDRRAAEASLRASQEQFRLLVQGVTDYAIYMLNPSGEISSWNAGAERIKGYTAADQDAGEPARALAVAAEAGRFEKEGQRVRKDGTIFWANVVIDALRAPNGTLLGFAKITRDITAQRDSRRALENARETLFQTQKMEAIGQLTGGVAHDFNNLLMVIKGSLELLRKRVLEDPRALHLLESAQLGASRGMALTQRMLAFARRQELKVEPVDLSVLVTGMTELLTRSLGSKVELELRFPSKLASPPDGTWSGSTVGGATHIEKREGEGHHGGDLAAVRAGRSSGFADSYCAATSAECPVQSSHGGRRRHLGLAQRRGNAGGSRPSRISSHLGKTCVDAARSAP